MTCCRREWRSRVMWGSVIWYRKKRKDTDGWIDSEWSLEMKKGFRTKLVMVNLADSWVCVALRVRKACHVRSWLWWWRWQERRMSPARGVEVELGCKITAVSGICPASKPTSYQTFIRCCWPPGFSQDVVNASVFQIILSNSLFCPPICPSLDDKSSLNSVHK